MNPRNALVVFYSRSGTTRALASAIARTMGADLEEIRDVRPRGGPLGYLRCRLDAMTSRATELRPMRCDPSWYGLVVVGTPVWSARVSAPVRVYLEAHRDRLPQVAFFLTDDAGREGHVFSQMKHLSGRHPLATLELSGRQVRRVALEERLLPFVRSIETASQGAAPGDLRRRLASPLS